MRALFDGGLVAGRWPRRALVVAAAAAGAIVAGALVDYAVTSAALPDVAPNRFEDGRLLMDPDAAEERRLRDGYITRAWLYATAVVVVLAGLVWTVLRPLPGDRRHAACTDLGVAGVVCLGATWAVMSDEQTLITDERMAYLPGGAMLLVAAVGSVLTRRPRSRPAGGLDAPERVVPGTAPGTAPVRRPMPPVAWAALGLAALTVVLAVLGHAGRECGDQDSGSDSLLVLAMLTGLAAGICGVAALFARRWLVALVTIPTPLLAAVALVAAACLE